MLIDMYNDALNSDPKVVQIWKDKDVTKKNERFRAVLKEYSETENFSSEWIMYIIQEGDNKDVCDTFCICSQLIQNLHFIKNKLNGSILRIGSECINKFLPELKGELKSQQSQTKNKDSDKRQCGVCLKFRISKLKPENVTTCKKCYDEGLRAKRDSIIFYVNGKNCKKCGKCNLRYEDTREYCFDCSNRISGLLKDCENCGKEFDIKAGEDWRKICITCYRNGVVVKNTKPIYQGNNAKSVGKVVKVCESCRNNFDSDPGQNWRKKCFPCYKASKL